VLLQAPAQPKPKRPNWQDHNRAHAALANAIALPLGSPPEFAQAWGRWCDYRTSRAVDARVASAAKPWTANAAEAGLRGCMMHAEWVGWPRIIQRIDEAIAGSWQGLNLDKMTGGTNGHHKPQAPHSKPLPTNL